MRDPMDRSRRLTDGTRWRTFMRLLRLDDLMTSYTNARPGAGLLVVDLDLGTASGLLASRCRTSPMYRAWYTSSMALGTRYPYGRRSDSGAPMNERWVRAVRSRRCSNAESTTPGSSAGTQVLRPPGASSRRRWRASLSAPPTLRCAQALVDRSFYIGQRLPRSSRLQLRCRGRITRKPD